MQLASLWWRAITAVTLAAGSMSAMWAGHSAAQNFPAKSVRIVVPYPAGGGNDMLARLFAHKLTEKWGQHVIVDNRGGASGMIGADIVAKHVPDGHTMLLCASPECALNATLYQKMPYDPQRDFQPVTLLAVAPLALTVHPSMPVHNVQQYIALAKKRPGEMNYSTVGAGSPHHIAGEWLKTLTGSDITHVPYKGGGPQLVELMAGHVQSGYIALPVIMPHIKSSRVRVIGVTTAKRSPVLPDVQTIAEAAPGMEGFDVGQWYGVVVPAGVPSEITAKLNADFVEQLKQPEMRARILELGADPVGSSVARFADFKRSEITKYRKIVQASHITVN